MFNNIFHNKTIIVTGHTGFKGSWLALWLLNLGAKVIGIALDPPTKPSHFIETKISSKIQDYRIDLCDLDSVKKIINQNNPDFIFHLAAQSLVRESYINPIKTWQTNVIGTLNILESLRTLKNRCIGVIVTSDKCYNNKEWNKGYEETDELGGYDPYSASKGSAEFVFKSYYKSFFSEEGNNIRIASARAGNVIGGGDWAKDRIVPDCVKAWSKLETVKLRNPDSTRPWQHVLEPLSGYLNLARLLESNSRIHGESFNFGPSDKEEFSVLDLVKNMGKYWTNVEWIIDNNSSQSKESSLLKLNCDKANNILKWNLAMDFQDTVRLTTEWYKSFYNNSDNIVDKTLSQISEYSKIAKNNKLEWTK